jgi:hypothetical protein
LIISSKVQINALVFIVGIIIEEHLQELLECSLQYLYLHIENYFLITENLEAWGLMGDDVPKTFIWKIKSKARKLKKILI